MVIELVALLSELSTLCANIVVSFDQTINRYIREERCSSDHHAKAWVVNCNGATKTLVILQL